MRPVRIPSYVSVVLFLSAAAGSGANARPDAGPLAPGDSAREARLEPGLRLELVAAEPLIESPVAAAFDEEGTLWVVEMRDYPDPPSTGERAAGRIKALADADGDGFFEKSSVFAEDLLLANGVLPWQGGLVVTAAPFIYFLEDRDGDGKEDARRRLFEGFSTENPQLLANHPTLGIDNWIYVASGLRGGDIRRGGGGDEPVRLGSMDFRFDLIRGRHEMVSGPGQFGLAFDDWGRRFICDNRHHIRHVVFEERYARRNPFLAVPEAVEDTSELEPGFGAAGSPVHPISSTWTNFASHAGRFTAACGIHIYGGDLLPDVHRGAAFTCEPAANLIHEEILRPEGATFRSKPAREGVEFLASRDAWFRPVNLNDGPDGALYVVDMYRPVIEHPAWLPPEVSRRLDFQAGKERGRIWRIVPDAGTRKTPAGFSAEAPIPEIARILEDPGSWRRMTAHRLILERQDGDAAGPLREIALSSRVPLARLHAAWLLQGLDRLDETLARRLIEDAHPRLRENGVVLTERWLEESSSIRDRVIGLAADPDARVRWQAALSLGRTADDRAVGALSRIGLAGAGDRWTRRAVASAAAERAGDLLACILEDLTAEGGGVPPGGILLAREIASLAGARGDAGEMADILERISPPGGRPGDGEGRRELRFACTLGLAEGAARRGIRLADSIGPVASRGASDRLRSIIIEASAVAGDRTRPAAERAPAARLPAQATWKEASPLLGDILEKDPEVEVRGAAVQALSEHGDPGVAPILLGSWDHQGRAIRREVIQALLRDRERALFLIAEVEAGRIAPGEVGVDAARRLTEDRRPEVRERARKVFDESSPADRKDALERYRAALSIERPDPRRGRIVFEKQCASCHRVGGTGVNVGPDIGDVQVKSPETLLADILDPNRAIDGNYVLTTVLTRTGEALSGVIASESSTSIALRGPEGRTDAILRIDIEEVRSSGASLMPEGIEKAITVEEMADLIHYLRSWRFTEG